MRLQMKRSDLASILSELISRTKLHFTSEEVLMESFRFSGRHQHKIEHDGLIQTILEFQELFVSGQADLSVAMMEFLKVWLTNHIIGMDQGYKKFFLDLGAK